MSITRHPAGERGAAALSLLTVGIIIALAIFAVMAVPLTRASDSKAKSRSAADAAALAGVEFVRTDLEQILAGGFPENGLGDLSFSSYESARSFAARNDAVLVAYTGPRLDNGWTSHARVRHVVDGKAAYSEATARMDLPNCLLEPPDEPEETDTPPPDGDEDSNDDDEEPEPVLTCDGDKTTIGALLGLVRDSQAKLVS